MHGLHLEPGPLDGSQRLPVQVTTTCQFFPDGRGRILQTGEESVLNPHMLD
jgi:hypothetical protein